VRENASLGVRIDGVLDEGHHAAHGPPLARADRFRFELTIRQVAIDASCWWGRRCAVLD